MDKERSTRIRVPRGLAAAAALLLAVMASGSAHAAKTDWPMYMMNPQRHGYSPVQMTGSLTAFAKVWEFEVPELHLVRTSPAVVDLGETNSRIFFGTTGGNLYALDAFTGEELWADTPGGSITAGVAVDVSTNPPVLFAAGGNNLYAYNALSGVGLWSQPTGGTIEYSSPVFWSSGGANYVYVGNESGIITEVQYGADGSQVAVASHDVGSGKIFMPPTIVEGPPSYLLFSTRSDPTANNGRVYRAEIPGLANMTTLVTMNADYFASPMFDGTHFYIKGDLQDNQLRKYTLDGVQVGASATQVNDSRGTASYIPDAPGPYISLAAVAPDGNRLWRFQPVNLLATGSAVVISDSQGPNFNPNFPDSSVSMFRTTVSYAQAFGTAQGYVQIYENNVFRRRVQLCPLPPRHVVTTPAVANVDGGANPMIFAGCSNKMFGIGIDSRAPELDCSATEAESQNPTKDPVTFHCTISERNTGQSLIWQNMHFRASADDGVTWAPDWTQVSIEPKDGAWDQYDAELDLNYTESVTFAYDLPEGEYTIEFSASDLIGGIPTNRNRDQGTTDTRFLGPDYLLVDKTPPEGTEARCGADDEELIYVNAPSFTVTWEGAWSATVDPGVSSGLSGTYDIVYQLNGVGAFNAWLTDTGQPGADFGAGNIPVELESGRTYGFVAAARDNVGNIEDKSGPAECVAVVDFVPPTVSATAPQYANKAAPTFTVSWENAADTGGSGLLDTPLYHVRYKVGDGGAWTDWLTDTDQTSAVFGAGGSPVVPQTDTVYYFEVTTRDKAGNVGAFLGGDGEDQTLVDLDDPEAAASCPVLVNTLTFPVNWEDASDTGGSGLTGAFDLWVNQDGGGWALHQAGIGALSVNFTGVDGSVYEFEVIAYDRAGNVQARLSAAECSTRVDTTAPQIIAVDSHDDLDPPDDDEVYHADQQVRILIDTDVEPAYLIEQLIWITSDAAGYDSGQHVLEYEGGNRFSFLWDTTGLDESVDYQVNLRFTDLATNSTTSLGALTIIIDNTDPVPTIEGPDAYFINTTTPTLTGTVTDAGGGSIRIMEYRIVSAGVPGPWITINTFTGTDGGTAQNYSIQPNTGGEGVFTVQVRAKDSAKNWTKEGNYASTTFEVDMTAPIIDNIRSHDIDDPAENNNVYHAGQQVRILFNEFNNEAGHHGTISITCPGNAPPTLVSNALLQEDGAGGYYYDWDTTAAVVESPDMANRCRIDLTLTDAAGNTAADSSFRITIDNTSPAVVLDQPDPVFIAESQVTFTGRADDTDRGLAHIRTVQYRLVVMEGGQPTSYGPWQTAAPVDGSFADADEIEEITVDLDLDDGDYRLELRAQDTASNWTAEDDYSRIDFTIDTVAPVIASIATRDSRDPEDDDEVYRGGQIILITVIERHGESDLPIRRLSISSATTGYSLLDQTMTPHPDGVYTFLWDTSALADQQFEASDYVARAILGDEAGNLSNEASITMIIDNTPPTLDVGLKFDFDPAVPGQECAAAADQDQMSLAPAASCTSLVTLADGETQILYVRDPAPTLAGNAVDTGGATIVYGRYRLQLCETSAVPCPENAWRDLTDGFVELPPADGAYDSPLEAVNHRLGPFEHDSLLRLDMYAFDNASNVGVTDRFVFMIDLKTELDEEHTNFYLNLPIEKNQKLVDADGNDVYVLSYRTDRRKTLADGWSDDIEGLAEMDVRTLSVTITSLGRLTQAAARTGSFFTGSRSITFESPAPDALGDFLASVEPRRKRFVWPIADYGIALQIGYQYRIDVVARDFAGNTDRLTLHVTPMVSFDVGTAKYVLHPEQDDPRMNSPADWEAVGRSRLETDLGEVVQYRIYFHIDPDSSNPIAEDASGIHKVFILDNFPAPIKYVAGTTYLNYLVSDPVTGFKTHRGPMRLGDPKPYVLEQVGADMQVREYGYPPTPGAVSFGIQYGWEITADMLDASGAPVFPGGVIPGDLAITYRSIVGAGAQQGIGYVNTCSVFALRTVQNQELSFQEFATGSAEVVVRRDKIFREDGIVMGKVFLDLNGNGRQDRGERGVRGVRLVMEDGTYVDTGEDGLFTLVGVRPGDHALKIDPHSLPAGMKPADPMAQLFYMPLSGAARVSFPLAPAE